ncbi:MAG: type II toxin-antitoxin system RelE/ParE family toxin [bacterium]
MTGSFEVRWAGVAESDLLGIIAHIAEDSLDTALEILKLATAPQRGRIVPELQSQGITLYRELIINPWRLMYKIEGNVVYVVSVIDGRRNVEDVLLSRLIK